MVPFQSRPTPWQRDRGLGSVLNAWRETPQVWRNIALQHTVAAREPASVPFDDRLAVNVREALRARGITQLYSHQAQAAALARAGRDVVIATPTASGKSLCYNVPILDALSQDPETRALYLFPTKALARDQEEGLRALLRDAKLTHGAITYDGDTPADARRAARQQGSVLLTNPDMLHSGILPHHPAWARFFANLKFVVIDELHTYRGVFGSHLANVLRRLLRIAHFHGSHPVVLFASATIGNPSEHAQRMLGRPVDVVHESGAPAGPRHVWVYNPPVVNAELGVRASYIKSTVRLALDLLRAQVPTMIFGHSRNNVEMMLKYLRDRIADDDALKYLSKDAVQAYRGGYLPQTRRNIEAGLRTGEIRCVVATNALELGIDIGALDAVICAGYPGSMAGLWQRFGRAGRRGEDSLALLVTSSAPLDQFFAAQPETLLSSAIEQARIDPDNVEILIQHMKCAAFELPFSGGERFGDVPAETSADVLDFLAQHHVLHPVQGSSGGTVYHWATDSYPANHVSLRSVGWDNVVIVDVARQQTMGEMDFRSAHTMLHEQAIYQHEGEQYQVERLDLDNHKAFVRHVVPDYYTDAMSHVKVTVISKSAQQSVGVVASAHDCEASSSSPSPASELSSSTPTLFGWGEVSVIEKVVGYKKIKYHTHENVGYGEVELPEMQMHTTAMWLTLGQELMASMPYRRPIVLDGIVGIVQALHTVACVGLMIDQRDMGRCVGEQNDVEQAPHKDRGAGAVLADGIAPTLFLYDQTPGGVGLAERLFEERMELLRRARTMIARCPCAQGCPACVGPSIGMTTPQANGPIDTMRKVVALHVLDALDGVGNASAECCHVAER